MRNPLLMTMVAMLAQTVWVGAVQTAELRFDLAHDHSALQSAARVSGRVSLAGPAPKLPPLTVFKSRMFCGATVANETLLVGADGGLRNAVVLLHAMDRRPPRRRAEQLVLDNKRCAFAPHVQVAPLGSELLLINSDPILHTVHARLGTETLFNVGLPTWRQVIKQLDRRGIIKINCDVLHTWMSAAIVVTDSPYFAVSDENGNFTVDHLPIGRYQAEIWHEKLGVKSIRLSVTGDSVISLDVVYGLEESRR